MYYGALIVERLVYIYKSWAKQCLANSKQTQTNKTWIILGLSRLTLVYVALASPSLLMSHKIIHSL